VHNTALEKEGEGRKPDVGVWKHIEVSRSDIFTGPIWSIKIKGPTILF
jgi:hypothetical protein